MKISAIKSKIPDQIKTRICDKLNARTRQWTNKRVKLAFIAFISISTGFSSFVISQAIFGNPNLTLFKISQAPVPVLPHSYPDYHVERTKLLHRKIDCIISYLDSLSLHDTSRYQAILKVNPNLIKNIQSTESLFNQFYQK